MPSCESATQPPDPKPVFRKLGLPELSLLSNYLFAVKSTGTWDSTLLSVSIENRIVFPATVPL